MRGRGYGSIRFMFNKRLGNHYENLPMQIYTDIFSAVKIDKFHTIFFFFFFFFFFF